MLTVVSVGIGLLLALPLGVLAFRYRPARSLVLGTSTALYTIPSLAPADAANQNAFFVTVDLPLGFGSVQNKQAVVEGKAQLGLSGTTDGTLGALGLVVLEDDKQLQNADNLVPVVNAEGPAGTDEVAEILDSLSETLTTDDLAELNRRVHEDREQPADVAQDYLEEQGLLGS